MIDTLYDMMAGGVFDRFPTMPTMILEAGVGWLPSLFERFEEHREHVRPHQGAASGRRRRWRSSSAR